MIPAILLMGPTASGKSALALRWAERFDGEIVSVDSAQIYRGMDVGTAKPDAATRARVPHHLVDILDPSQAYSAARFAMDARSAIASIRARGKVPIVAGGTMLYFKALREGLSQLPPADPAVRARIDARAAREGWRALHAELARCDPATAARLAPTDSQRIQRALEVHEISGKPLSALQGQREAASPDSVHDVAIALLPVDRARLHRAIAERFDAMLEAGLEDEVRRLRADPALSEDLPSIRCVGYRQVWRYLAGATTREAMRVQAIAATRQLAKRQITWLRATEATTLDPYEADTLRRLDALMAAVMGRSARA